MMLRDKGLSIYWINKIKHITNNKKRLNKKQNKPVYQIGSTIYKYWENHNERLLQSLASDFYNRETAGALEGIIFDGDAQCRGYVAHKCKLGVSDKIYDLFINLLIETTRKTGWVYQDCHRQNIAIYNGKPTLIDFDSIKKLKKNQRGMRNHKYRKAIQEMF